MCVKFPEAQLKFRGIRSGVQNVPADPAEFTLFRLQEVVDFVSFGFTMMYFSNLPEPCTNRTDNTSPIRRHFERC